MLMEPDSTDPCCPKVDTPITPVDERAAGSPPTLVKTNGRVSFLRAGQRAGQAIGIPSDLPCRATVSHRKTVRAASFGHAFDTTRIRTTRRPLTVALMTVASIACRALRGNRQPAWLSVNVPSSVEADAAELGRLHLVSSRRLDRMQAQTSPSPYVYAGAIHNSRSYDALPRLVITRPAPAPGEEQAARSRDADRRTAPGRRHSGAPSPWRLRPPSHSLLVIARPSP